MQIKNALKVLLVMAAILLPSLAFGQIFGDENIPADDVSTKQFLQPLFGELTGRGGSDPFVALLYQFNLGVLVLGGILVFYTLVAGTLSTAHDGEMLGKRWSSMWVPIRTTLGAAAIMPSIGGGYAVIQAVVMWLAMQGVAGGNLLWSTYLDSDPMETAFFVAPGSDRQIRETFHDMFMSNVCTSGFKTSQGMLGTTAELVGAKPLAANVTPVTTEKLAGYAYGPMGTMCGKVILSRDVSGSGTENLSADAPASAAALVDAAGLNAALAAVHLKHMRKAQGQLKILSDRLVKSDLDQETFDSKMNELVSSYSQELQTTARAQYDSQKEAIQARLVEGLKKDGWAMAGMYYMAITRAQDEITRAISQFPGTASGQLNGSGSFVIDAATGGGIIQAGLNMALNAYVGMGERKAWFLAAENLINNGNQQNLTSIEQIADDATGKSWVMKVASWFMNDDMVLLSPSEFGQQNQNPIIMAKNLGETMTGAAWTGFALGVAVLGASGAGAGLLGDWAEVLAMPLFAIFSMLVVPGATLSTYVPMIPYILWLGVIIGWVILVVEAVFAAPIWAVAHMAPDGDGVVGRGGQGYMLVLSLVLRPPLMILGLVAAITLMKPVGYFINSTFLGAFAMGVNPGPMALTQLIAGCIIYVVVMVSVIHRVFTLIHVIPDRILRWIGGGGNELGEQAQGMESFSAAKTVGAAAAMNQVGEVSRAVGQGVRQLGMKRADKANAESIRGEESRSRMAQVEANKNDQAYRAGLDAVRASADARKNTATPEVRERAAMANQMARDARIQEAETDVDHFMSQSGFSGGLEGFRNQTMGAREQMASETAQRNPALGAAMDFANKLDQARERESANPKSPAMGQFLGAAHNSVRENGLHARPWEVAAAKGMEFETERQNLSAPLPSAADPKKDSGDES